VSTIGIITGASLLLVRVTEIFHVWLYVHLTVSQISTTNQSFGSEAVQMNHASSELQGLSTPLLVILLLPDNKDKSIVVAIQLNAATYVYDSLRT